MNIFMVDGSKRRLSDIIIENKVTGESCLVASYGLGVRQVRILIDEFQQVTLVADESHSRLNPNAYAAVIDLNESVPHFTFKVIKTHAKFALIDDEIIVFTSANLSANRRMESYMVGRIDEVNGIESVKKIMHNPKMIFKKQMNEFDLFDDNMNMDFML
jgi:hypothetical protein